MKIRNRFIAVLLFAGWVGSANAALITISTNATVLDQPSYTFGDWIFELVNRTNPGFYLIDNANINNPGGEDFIVSNSCCAKEFTLRKLDNSAFSLLGVRIAGVGGGSTIGGVSVPSPGSKAFQNFAFSGQASVTNVGSVLFSPNQYIQLSAFEVDGGASVPAPATVALFGLGLAGLGWARRKKA